MLELLGEEHTISNASWLSAGQSSKPLPAGALGSKVLCQRHNGALSELDSCAKVFFVELLEALSESSRRSSKRRVSLDGDRLELWVLKACCGAFASGNLLESRSPVVKEPPLRWLNILFSGAAWESGAGLHIREVSMTPHNGYAIGPVYGGEACVGGGIEFAGVELFVLLEAGLEKEAVEQSSKLVSRLILRPGILMFETAFRTTEIELQWRTWIPKEGVRYFPVGL